MTRKKKRWVVCSAMLMTDGSIVTGIRHYSPEMREIMRKAYGKKYHLKVKAQGFVDQYGKFLTRRRAWTIAKANRQIRYKVSIPGTLYSENLY